MARRIALKLLNGLWYSIALGIIVAASLIIIGREALPRTDLADKQFLQYINQHTGAQIDAAQLQVKWVSIYPEVSAERFTIDTADAHVELHKVFFTINLLQSLLQRTPVMDSLKLQQADIRYTLPENSSTTPPDLERDWRFINRLFNNDTQIKNIAITLQRQGWQKTVKLDDFRVEQGMINKKFFLRLQGNNAQSLSAVGRFSGDSLRESQGLLYIKTDNLALNDWIPTLAQNSTASGEAWLKWDGMQQADFTAKLKLLSSSNSKTIGNITIPPEINSTLSGQWRKKHGDSYIDIQSLSLADDTLLSTVRLLFNNNHLQKWRIQTPALSLDSTVKLLPFLPEGELKELFSSLHLNGYLRNLDIAWDNSKPLTERMKLQANADNISSGPWSGVPAFTGVSGYLQSGIGYGFIDLDSNNGFSMLYPDVYHQPIVFQRAAGRVQWHWQPEEKTVLVGSDYASLSGDPGEARGNFWLHLPLHGADFHSELYLSIGLRNSKAKYRNMLIPYILPKDLLAWLDSSIKEADLSDAGFLYRSGLSHGETKEGAVQFYGNIQKGELEFHPEWPPLKNIDAHILVDNHNAEIRAQHATLYNTVIDAAQITVQEQHPGTVLGINGRAHGSPDDGLRLLRESPLHQAVGNGMDAWKITQGNLNTALQLQIPLSGATLPQTENVQLQLSNTQLDMQDLRLPFRDVNSNLSYDSTNGLQAPAIKATLFNKAVTATIDSKKSTQGSTIQIAANSSANMSDIAAWSNITPLKMLTGSADYSIGVQLGPFNHQKNSERIGQVQVNSQLKQISAVLPEPFTKNAGEAAPFTMTVDLLSNSRQRYRFNYDQLITGTLTAREGSLTGGDIQLLGDTANTSNLNAIENSGELLIHGNLSNADIQQWIDMVASYNKLIGSQSNNTGNTIFPSISLTANNATWKDFVFSSLAVNADHNNSAWNLSINTKEAQGKILFYDSGKTPDVIVDTLTINRSKTKNNDSNLNKATQNNIDFSTIPALNIKIDHLIVDAMDIGSISTALRSTPTTLQLNNLKVVGKGYWLRDGSGLNGSTLLWHQKPDGSTSSEFHGLLQMSGEQPVLEHLGIDPFIIGKRVSIFADLSWPGAPQDIDINTMAGSVYTEGRDGKYLQAKPNIALHALSIVNITTWLRRLQLDFSDLSNDGISFDEYKGKILFGKGEMRFVEPLEIESPSSTFKLSGKVLLESNVLDLRLIATLPVGNNATWIAALAGGLPAAAGVYVASKIFDKQISTLSSLSYRITGPSSEPKIEFERIAPLEEKPKNKKKEESVVKKLL